MPVDPSLAGLLEAIAAGTPLSDLSPADARAVFRAMTVDTRPPGSLDPVASVEDDKVAGDRKSTRLNSSHVSESRMPSSA